jgi:alkylhydroperoxidase family enzyme
MGRAVPSGDGGRGVTRADPDFDAALPAVRIPPASGSALRPLARLTSAVTARATGGEPLRIFATLGRHPRLFRAWLRFAATLMFRGELSRIDRELITLRTAWRCGSWYEWVQHAALAERAGLAPAEIDRTVEGPAAEGWQPRQRLLLQATDELHDLRAITDRTWRALSAELGDRELVELCLLVGHYEMLAMTLNSLGVEPEPSALAKLRGGPAASAEHLRDGLAATRRTRHAGGPAI